MDDRQEPGVSQQTASVLRAHGDACVIDFRRSRVHYFDDAHLVIDRADGVEVGMLVKIEAQSDFFVDAIVAWTAGGICGCRVLDERGGAVSPALASDTTQANSPLEPIEIFHPPEPVGLRLGRLRRQCGLTQEELAATIGVSKPKVWKWEQGLNRPKDEMLDRISKALDVPKSEFTRPQGMLRSGVDVIRGCRFYIARACNVPPTCVKITIEA